MCFFICFLSSPKFNCHGKTKIPINSYILNSTNRITPVKESQIANIRHTPSEHPVSI